mgnify:CR=1 FL=1
MVPALAVPVLGVAGVDLLSLEGVVRLKIFATRRTLDTCGHRMDLATSVSIGGNRQ